MPLYKLPKRHTGFLSLACLVVIFLGIVFGLCTATQFTAKKLNYRPELGKPLIGRFYNPIDIFKWQLMRRDYPVDHKTLGQGMQIFIATVGVSMALAIFMNYLRTLDTQTDVHGSAHWADYKEIRQAGLVGNKQGLYIGAIEHDRRTEYLKFDDEGNVVCFAPTRSGKGVGLVVPNLLSWCESVIVLDIRSENWLLTARWRKEKLKSFVMKFDPTSNDGSSVRVNPLYEVRLGENEVRDVQNIADMIVDPDGKGKHDHWRLSAYNLLTGVILHVIYAEKDKTLAGVTNFLSNPESTVEDTFESMLQTIHDPEQERGWINPVSGNATKTHPVISSVARELLNKSTEERSGIVSTALSFLAMYRDPIIAANTSVSDFRIIDLMDYEKPVSLYMVIPPSDMSRVKPVVRLILNQIVRRLVEDKMILKDGRINRKHKNRLLLMLDEFAALGRMEFIQDAFAYMAGYGLKGFIVLQDLSQLFSTYGRDESITGNCRVRIAFAPNKLETAQNLSHMAGASTVIKHSKNLTRKRTQLVNAGISQGTQEAQRPLVTVDETMRLPPEDTLIFVSNMPPIHGKKMKYYQDHELNSRARIPAPEHSDRLSIDMKQIAFPEYREKKTEQTAEENPVEALYGVQEEPKEQDDRMLL